MDKLIEAIEKMEDAKMGDFSIEVFGSEVVVMNKKTKNFIKVYPGHKNFLAEEGEDLEKAKEVLVLAGYEPIKEEELEI